MRQGVGFWMKETCPARDDAPRTAGERGIRIGRGKWSIRCGMVQCVVVQGHG